MTPNMKMKLQLNSLYGKMCSKLTDEEEKFVRKCFKHETESHKKNCTIIVIQNSGRYNHTNIYKFDDYRVATGICNILDNTRYTECHYSTKDNTSFYDKAGELLYADTDSTGEQKDAQSSD